MQLRKDLNVLIAEDDFIVSETIQRELEKLGYKVVGKASDGSQALEMTKSLKPEVVLMDVEMPVMDGLEATRQISRTCPTPVVMLTAYDTPQLVARAGKAGAGAYLVKMPAGREIERAIAIAIARFDDMMEMRQLNAELQQGNEELRDALNKVDKLSGMLPICASCKKIRDDEDYWHEVADYFRDRSEVEFTHSICPQCATKLYPECFPEEKKDA